MPSSLARVLPFALVFSTRRPVSVCGTGDGASPAMALFSAPGTVTSGLAARHHRLSLLATSIHSEADLSQRARHRLHSIGTGIFTGCPSPTLSSLGLGPTNPTRTDLPSETFDFRRTWFSHVSRYSCQHSHSCPLQHPLPGRLLRWQDAPLPCRSFQSVSPASVPCFSPVPFSAQSRSTSELLRTLSRMAASKPTSWLSRHDHSVSHLAWTSGP